LGSDAVVNCVGILNETSKQKFTDLQAYGAGQVAKIAADCGVKTFVHFSAIGADIDSQSKYLKSKAEGEAIVKASFKNAIIIRPVNCIWSGKISFSIDLQLWRNYHQ
jgi:NADH dehydrogenase